MVHKPGKLHRVHIEKKNLKCQAGKSMFGLVDYMGPQGIFELESSVIGTGLLEDRSGTT